MRIAITGDFHLGFNADATVQAGRALKACANADVVVCAGDLFDSRVPSQETLNDALQVFSHARGFFKPDAKLFEVRPDGSRTPLEGYPPIIAIHGTHERRSRGLINPVQVLDSAYSVVNAHNRCIEIQVGGERACFFGIGGVPEEYARQVLKKVDAKPVSGAFNVFVFHQSLEEAMPLGGETLCVADLPDGFDLYVDGHIHWPQDIKADGRRVIIPGSTVVTQMRRKEAGPKSVTVFDTKTAKAGNVVFSTRPFVFEELSFEGSSPNQIIAFAREKLNEISSREYSEQPQVKLKLSGNLPAGYSASSVDTAFLLAEFAELRLFVDKDFESAEFAASAKAVQQARSGDNSVRELSLSLLCDALKRRGIAVPQAELDELLDALCEADVPAALKSI